MAGSYIRMSSADAKKLALECKARIDSARQQAVNHLVKQEKQKWSRVRGLLRRPEPSDEQVLSGLKYNWDLDNIKFQYHYNEDAYKRILLATQVSDTVHVSTEDLELLLGL